MTERDGDEDYHSRWSEHGDEDGDAESSPSGFDADNPRPREGAVFTDENGKETFI